MKRTYATDDGDVRAVNLTKYNLNLANVKILGTWAGIYSIEKVCDPHLFIP